MKGKFFVVTCWGVPSFPHWCENKKKVKESLMEAFNSGASESEISVTKVDLDIGRLEGYSFKVTNKIKLIGEYDEERILSGD